MRLATVRSSRRIYPFLLAGFAAVAMTQPDFALARHSELKFAWPADATAHVLEKATKDNVTTEFSYTISLSPRSPARSFQLDYSNYDVVRVNGEDANTPAMRKALEPGLPLLASWPTLLISPSGEFEGTGDFQEMMRKATAFVETRGNKELDAQEQAQIEAFLGSPAMKNAITQKFGDAWRDWVELWLGEVPKQGMKVEYRSSVPIGNIVLEVPLYKEYVGEGTQGAIKLAAESTIEGPVATKALREFIGNMQGQLKPNANFSAQAQLKSFKRIRRDSVETDPRTLQPKYARSEQTAMIEMNSGESVHQIETHEYFFDWSKDRAEKKAP